MRKPKNKTLSTLLSLLNQEIIANGWCRHQPFIKSRRKFISNAAKASVGAGIALSLPNLLTACKNKSDENILDVAILGGGMAGLNCANHLLPSNLSFQIFEASKRLGGRILTHYNDSLGLGIFPEFGGDFIDSDHEDMLDLAKEFNLELIDLVEEQEVNNYIKDIYYFDNRSISETEIIAEFKNIAPKLVADIDALGENYDTEKAIALDNTPLSDYFKSLNCKQWLKDILDAAYIAEFGLDCSEQSTLNFLDMIDTNTNDGFKVFGASDERYRIKGGNSKVIEALVGKIGSNKIKTNHEVKAIKEQKDSTYLITFTDESTVVAKAIVCTIPFTILRKIKLDLKNISSEKRKCIDELGYGTNTKLVLGYKDRPWREQPNHAMGYLFHKDISNGWDGSYTKTENNINNAYICFFGGKFSENLNAQSFKNKMAPPTHVWKTELPEQTVNKMVDDLNSVFPKSKEKFLDKHVFVNWIDYPFAKGSYSCYKVGQWSTIAGLEIEPIGNFLFAGEHCSELFQGFMNGAAATGKQVATAILESIKVS
ncbi:MAG: NAD(P)/FAD-dependent oxidoreductase [Chitinophagales bacterium]